MSDGIRVFFEPGTDPDEAFALLAKALKHPLTSAEVSLALEDTRELRAELTGIMERMLPAYEAHYLLLEQTLKRARGRRREGLLEEQGHLRARYEWLFRIHFNRYYADQFLAGKRLAGNGKGLDRSEREIVRRLSNSEAQYALNFMLDAQTGEYRMPLEKRGALYGNALDELKWLGFLYGDLSQDRFVRWVIDAPQESCVDCLFLAGRLDLLESEIANRAAKRTPPDPTEAEHALLAIVEANRETQGGRWGIGVYRAQELVRMAIVPQSGRLTCTTNCKCGLAEVERPAGRGKQPERREPFEALIPKKPTMLQRRTRRGERVKLAGRAGHWKHEHVRRAGVEPLPKARKPD